MPDGGTSGVKSRRLLSAISDVEAYLAELPGAIRRLTNDELQQYRTRNITRGWRLDVHISDKLHRLDLLIDNWFPREPPRIAMADRPEYLSVPHVEKDGVLCLLPDSSAVDPFNPRAVVQDVLRRACELIEETIAGTREQDFRDEFHSYWALDSSERGATICSLLRPEGPSRLIKIWLGRERYVVADRAEEIGRWLDNLLQDKESGKREFHNALLLWLETPLVPKEYPRTANDVRKLARQYGAEALLEQLVSDADLARVVVVLGAASGNGPCFGAVVVSPLEKTKPPGGHNSEKVTAGFRPGKMPRGLHVTRYLGSTCMARRRVSRGDPSWIHGRDQDERFGVLRNATVAILGCGSVGAPVAHLLAKAGVGRFFLVDPEKLAWANIGRHTLGARSVDHHKADALADRIRKDFPHILGIDSRCQSWQELSESDMARLASAELIVSAMGAWAAEGALNEWHITQSRHFPIVYGWTEAHGVGGHAVAICSQGGCFQCGVDVMGSPALTVAAWPPGAVLKQEPACGAVFQPYGPIEVGNAVNLVAELCLDCLLKGVTSSTHRVWVARKSLLDRAGAIWSPAWASLAQTRPQGAFVEERAWPAMPACPECGAPGR